MDTGDLPLSGLTTRGTPDRTVDQIYVVNGATQYRSTINNELGITGAPVGTTDSQTLTNKTFTAPTITSPVLSGTITGTYTLGGTPTFPANVVTLTGSQTLTNKILTSPTISSPTITNASITQDTVTGFTTANSGTLYGVAVTSGIITSASVGTSSVVAGIQLPDKMKNPYKFSVYRAAAHTSSTTATVVSFDTKTYDTGSNVDVVTNKGRFTAPIAGFYHFSARAGNTAASGVPTFAFLYKNGARVKSGSGAISSPTGSFSTVSADVQLAASDYIEVYFVGGSGSTMDVTASECYFDGHLMSAT